MPALLGVVELVNVDTLQVILIIAHFDEILTFNLNLTLIFSLDKLYPILPHQIISSGVQDAIALTVPSVNVQDFARYSTGCL